MRAYTVILSYSSAEFTLIGAMKIPAESLNAALRWRPASGTKTFIGWHQSQGLYTTIIPWVRHAESTPDNDTMPYGRLYDATLKVPGHPAIDPRKTPKGYPVPEGLFTARSNN